MFPDGKTVELQQFDGLSAYSYLNAIFLVSGASLLAAAFVQSLGRKIASGTTLAITAGVIWFTSSKILAQDLSALGKHLETLTGIAANHGSGDYTVTASIWPWLTIIALALQAFALILFLGVESSWPKRLQKTERQHSSATPIDEQDSIGIWDSQRK